MPNAREVVEAYLANKREGSATQMQDDMVRSATASVIEFLPDGFTKKDVRACVKALLDNAEGFAEYKVYRRSAIVNKKVDDLSAENVIFPKESGHYAHVAF